MVIFDLILIIIFAGFIFYGLFFGLIRTLGSLLGLVLGIWLSFIFYLTVCDWAKNLFFGNELIGKIIVFLTLFTIFNRLICFLFVLLDRVFDLISIIPFLKTINRLAGAILGFLIGGLVLGLILMFISHYVDSINWLENILIQSKVVPVFLKFINILMPLLPDFINKI